jgi:hypothetical protein
VGLTALIVPKWNFKYPDITGTAKHKTMKAYGEVEYSSMHSLPQYQSEVCDELYASAY